MNCRRLARSVRAPKYKFSSPLLIGLELEMKIERLAEELRPRLDGRMCSLSLLWQAK